MKDEPQPIWTFGYKKGNAPVMNGQVQARAEAAFAVAQAWCRHQGVRGPLGDMKKFILADESILSEPDPLLPLPLPSPIEATTNTANVR